MSGHTPGPWTRLDLGKWQGVDIGPKASGETPCIVHWSGFDSCGLPQREYAANARLIAAAPDLLEALEMVRDADDDYKADGLQRIPSIARAKIDAAIAKAKDQTP